MASNSTAYPPPNLAVTMPGAAYPPPNVQPVSNEPSIRARSGAYSPAEISTALANAGAPPAVIPTFTAISGAESRYGASPVSGVNRDGSRDYGVFQINAKAHPQYGGAAVASMPLDQQAKHAVEIYNKEGLHAWSTYNNGAYKGFIGGKGAGPSGPPVTTSAAAPAQPATPGNMIASLFKPTGDDGKGPTPVEQAGQALGGGKQQAQTSRGPDQGQMLQLQQAAAQSGVARQQQLEARAQQLASAVQARGMQPISWGSAPPGTDASAGAGQQGPRVNPQALYQTGQQQQQLMDSLSDYVPGTTLNSIGG